MKALSAILFLLASCVSALGQEARTPGIGGTAYSAAAAPVVAAFGLAHSNGVAVTATWTQPAGAVLLDVQMFVNLGSLTISSLKDCAGSSACGGSSTDTFTDAVTCTTLNGKTLCESYICVSALSAGASAITFTPSSLGTNIYVSINAITGAKATSCLDQTGTAASVGTANPHVTSAGNIGFLNELVIATSASTTTPTAVSPFSQVQVSGGFLIEKAASPTQGAPVTANVSAASGTWEMMLTSWRAN
jgi:hypothetical protein